MDGDLLARLKARDPRAQRELRARHLAPLAAVCERILGAGAQAREIAEDVITDVAMVHVDKIRLERSLPTYLRMVAVRRCARLKAAQGRHDELGHHADHRDGPEAALVEADEAHRWRRRIGRCLARLQPRVRLVLRMRFHEDATQEAIGTSLGVSKQYVHKLLSKSLVSLRKCLEAGDE
jgi:RNA polymerase sigma factor (sigma-70 family)